MRDQHKQFEDSMEQRRKIDRWFDIHGHLECEDCNPRPVNKRKTQNKTPASSAGSQSSKQTKSSQGKKASRSSKNR